MTLNAMPDDGQLALAPPLVLRRGREADLDVLRVPPPAASAGAR
jgi:hypothetical protein